MLCRTVETPAGGITLLIPQIAPWAGQAGRCRIALPLKCQAAGFMAHPGHRGPEERIVAATFKRVICLAKVGGGELSAAGKQPLVQIMRFAEIAQL
ncbi:hypothetical protein D3C76_1541630 [compost metagenome]